MRSGIIAICLLSCSCAPIALSDRVDATTVSERKERHVRPNSAATAAKMALVDGGAGVQVSVRQSERCDEVVIAQARNIRHLQRAPDWESALLWAGAGAVGAGLGGWVVADAANIPSAGDPHTRNPVGRNGAYAIGVGLLAAGGAALITGVATAARGIDLDEDLGTTPLHGGSVEVACKEVPVPGIQIDMVPVVGGLEMSPTRLGVTSAAGTLRFSRAELRSFFESTPGAHRAKLRFGESSLDIDLRANRAALRSEAIETVSRLTKRGHFEEAQTEQNFADMLALEESAAPTGPTRNGAPQGQVAALGPSSGIVLGSCDLEDGTKGLAMGNGNGRIERGEMVVVTCRLENRGVGLSFGLRLDAVSENSDVEVFVEAVQVEEWQAADVKSMTFRLSVKKKYSLPTSMPLPVRIKIARSEGQVLASVPLDLRLFD